ncbi:MAG: family 16 glycosylhydrolase [Alphaproteobacteria bacterium]|nr:family 16 glycosylhydrolase [Alphaproteobacteria bacterium]
MDIPHFNDVARRANEFARSAALNLRSVQARAQTMWSGLRQRTAALKAFVQARRQAFVRRGQAFLARPFVQVQIARARKVRDYLHTRPQLSGGLASSAAILLYLLASPVLFTGVVKPEAPAAPIAPATTAPVTTAPAAPAVTSRPPPRKPDTEGFVERFRTLDEDQRWYVADRGGNGDWTANDFPRSQVTLSPEGLVLTFAKAAPGWRSRYSSGEVSTLKRFKYGYFEARMRMAKGPGINNGVFTYVLGDSAPNWNEIDIEMPGRNTREVALTIHLGKRVVTRKVKLPFDAAAGYHVYSFDWQPDWVRWYVDNKLVHEETGPVATGLKHPQNFFIDLWGSETLVSWLGKIDPDKVPATAAVSCVAYAKTYDGSSLCEAQGAESAG